MDEETLQQLMTLGETFKPVVEWAAGQKAMVLATGLSDDTADAYARQMLMGFMELAFENLRKELANQ